jgi:steroid delta-isomerase-like uncharacterized protein
MSTETNKATVRRMNDQLWNEGRVDLIGEFFTEDTVSHAAGLPSSSGLEELKASVVMGQNAYADLRLSFGDLIADGDKVAYTWTLQGVHQGELYGIPPTGKQVTTSGVTINRLVNGRIVETWMFPDTMGLMQQLGVVPTPGAD